MTLELLFNIFLLLFFSYCFVSISSIGSLPNSDSMGPALWPQIILVLLILCFIVNIYHTVKKEKTNPDKVVNLSTDSIKAFFASKLFAGMAIVFIMAMLLDPLGFIVTAFLFLSAYGFLLGQRNYGKLFAFSLLATFVLFFLFSKGLSIMLPRGYGFLRQFSLMLENI